MKITGFESNNELLSIIGSRVKDFRIGMNLTQEDLALDTGLSLRTIINIETGKDVKLTSLLYVLRKFSLIQNLDGLIPDQETRPSDMHYLGKKRERVRRSKKSEKNDTAWKWGEDE